MASYDIDVAFEEQLVSNVTILSQQKMSKFYNAVTVRKTNAKHVDFPRLGATSAYEVTSRHAPTVMGDLPHTKVRVTLRDFTTEAVPLDQFDEQKTLIDFKSPYAQAVSAALARQLDDLIIAAADASTVTVDNTGGTSTEAITNTIDDDFGGSNSDITVEKLLEARRLFAAEEVDLDLDELYFALDPTSHSELLGEAEITSSDYNAKKVLVDGKINEFLGYKFIVTNRLNKASGVNDKKSLAFVKSGIGLAMNQDISVSIKERPDYLDLTQIRAQMSANAVRLEPNKVIVVEAYRA